jgi:thioredoxin 1
MKVLFMMMVCVSICFAACSCQPSDKPVAKEGDICPPDTTAKKDAVNNTPDVNSPFTAIGKYQFIDFGAETCKPCIMMVSVMDSLRLIYKDKLQVTFYDVTKQENKPRASAAGVRVIPMQFIIDPKGTVLFTHEGYWALQAVRDKLKELGLK